MSLKHRITTNGAAAQVRGLRGARTAHARRLYVEAALNLEPPLKELRDLRLLKC